MNEVDAQNIIEEQYGGESTGVEFEDTSIDDGESEHVINPWDPEKIRVSTKSFSLRNVLDMIDDESLELAPDFQRNRVWKKKQKSRLIESLLLQIPLPAFYFAEDEDGLLRVVDGLQRLSTIHNFVRTDDPMALADLEYLEVEEGKKFKDLSPVLQRRLFNAQIVVHIIDPSTPDDVKYDIFKRINTGGAPLNAMEVRHCMSRARSREFLKRCCQSEVFNLATGGALRDHIRMNDREAILRFMAFKLLNDYAEYDGFGTLESLLDWAAKRIDNPADLSESNLEEMFENFEKAMTAAWLLFERHAFRKWPMTSDALHPINRALFESWAVTLSNFDLESIQLAKDQIIHASRRAMTDDTDYIASISSATSSSARVRNRFEVPLAIVKGAIG